MATGRYQAKQRGMIEPTPFRKRSHRSCTTCGRSLSGRRGHGFPTPNGKGIECQPGCIYRTRGDVT